MFGPYRTPPQRPPPPTPEPRPAHEARGIGFALAAIGVARLAVAVIARDLSGIEPVLAALVLLCGVYAMVAR